MNYEINFLILQSQTEDADKIREAVKKLIVTHDGKVTDELIYQKRKLAYEINHEQYGFFTVYRFDLDNGEKLKDLTKDLNLEKGLTRHIMVKSSEIPKLQKEIGKEPKSEEERKAEAMKNAPAKKVGKKVLDEISKETAKQAPVKKVVAKKETVAIKDTPVEEKKTVKAVKKTSKEVTKKTKKVTKPATTTKGKKESSISMDDLDKKLDEILDI